ncbi:MAG: response regulator [Candidatus Cloacimonadota bacterium]|nr:response regulator [Candidatus Cloacimonadota bacterium]
MKILVVDDDKSSRIMMAEILKKYGECKSANSGTEAVGKFKRAVSYKEPFDLITLDITMPDKNGLEVLTEIRKVEKNKKAKPVKILMVTARDDKTNVLISIKAGCDGYIKKPISADTVLDKVKALGFKLK